MRKCRGRIVASILALALVLTSGGLSVLAEGENSQQPANVSEEQQEAAGQSETDPEQESQPGEETESTGKQPAEEQTTEGQSDESSSVAVSQWSWIDEDGILQEDNGVWGIGMPGASEENPLTQDALSAMLPSQVQAVTANGETVTLDITWDLSAIPAEGIWSGEQVFTASLPEGYQMADGVSGLSVTVQLGEAETYDLTLPDGNPPYSDEIVEGVSPRGTTIDLFDYWAADRRLEEDDSDPWTSGTLTNSGGWTKTGDVPDIQNKGINAGHAFLFGSSLGSNFGEWNQWSGSADVRDDIVKNTLVNGFPQLALTELEVNDARYNDNTGYYYNTLTGRDSTESLAYLFDPEIDSTGKKSYTDVQGLLQVDDQGYFYYDSRKNYAAYYEDTNSFALYEGGAVESGGASHTYGQFFPFNAINDVTAGKGPAGNWLPQYYWIGDEQRQVFSNSPVMNHYFGLTMTTQFIQQDGGYTKPENEGGEKVTYEFSGDDDVWVFIDDVLVADLGGIHDPATLNIDFSTGDIIINKDKFDFTDRNGNGSWDYGEPRWSIEESTTLLKQYQAAGLDTTTSWNGNTFADNTYHTLKFFYLERGNVDSNLSLKFNFVSIPESGIIKVDQAGNHIAGAEFELYKTSKDYLIDDAELICSGVTNKDGELIFVDEEQKLISLNMLSQQGCKYLVLHEKTVPSGYRTSGDMELRLEDINGNVVLLASNEWETGAYASAKVTAQTNPDIQLVNNETIKLTEDGGTLFAVVLQRQDMKAELTQADNWKAVYGDPESGWHVSDDGNTLDGIITAAKANPYVFEMTASGAYEVNVENVPGDITKYYYMLADSGKAQTEYTIGYYYTSADSVSGAESSNTVRVNSDGFDRVFSANLYVPNIQNNLYVQKLDENGTPVSAANGKTATFALYHAADVSVNTGGTYTINSGAQPAYTQTTSDMTTPLVLTGGAMFSRIAEGEYYLIETSAPAGYKASDQAIHVIVDDTGVYADAGKGTDGISVRRGVGSVVRSMLQFATDDDVDATLHDIKTELVSGTRSDAGFHWDSWDGDSANDLHLQFQNAHQVLEYGTVDGTGNPYFEVESGWSKLLVRQCLDEDHTTISKKKQDLDDQDLTNLFSGTVTVCVENQRINSLTLSKTVVDESGTVDEDQQFTFTLTLKAADGTSINDGFTAERSGASETETVQFTNSAATVTLKDGESITITGLPTGAIVQITESDIQGQTYDTTYVVGNGSSESGKETGGLTITDSGSVNVAFTNTYVPTGDFSFTKTDKDEKPLGDATFALYRLDCKDGAHNHSSDEIKVNEKGEFQAGYEYKDCWTLVQTTISNSVDGEVKFTAIPTDGEEYRLVEIKTPDGYAAPGGQWKIEYRDGKFQPKGDGDASVGNPPAIKEGGTGDTVTYSIKNYQPGELPFSGNTGIKMFLIIGGILMAAGAAGTIWYVRRKRRLA